MKVVLPFSATLLFHGLRDRYAERGIVGDRESPNAQRFLVDVDVYLAPDVPLGAAVLASVPLAFTLSALVAVLSAPRLGIA